MTSLFGTQLQYRVQNLSEPRRTCLTFVFTSHFPEYLALPTVMGVEDFGLESSTQATDVDLGTNLTTGIANDSLNASMVEESPSFIFTPYAYAISGVFVWSALFLACFSVSLSKLWTIMFKVIGTVLGSNLISLSLTHTHTHTHTHTCPLYKDLPTSTLLLSA